MKRLLSLILVLTAASVASADVWFEVDERYRKSSYSPCNLITINIVTDDAILDLKPA